MPQLRAKLEQYLSEKGIDSVVEPLTPDASTRRYFRLQHDGRPVVACVYPDDIKHLAVSYMDVSRVFRENGLPVAEVHDFDEVLGVIVVEDLGDTILRPELESCNAQSNTEDSECHRFRCRSEFDRLTPKIRHGKVDVGIELLQDPLFHDFQEGTSFARSR